MCLILSRRHGPTRRQIWRRPSHRQKNQTRSSISTWTWTIPPTRSHNAVPHLSRAPWRHRAVWRPPSTTILTSSRHRRSTKLEKLRSRFERAAVVNLLLCALSCKSYHLSSRYTSFYRRGACLYMYRKTIITSACFYYIYLFFEVPCCILNSHPDRNDSANLCLVVFCRVVDIVV